MYKFYTNPAVRQQPMRLKLLMLITGIRPIRIPQAFKRKLIMRLKIMFLLLFLGLIQVSANTFAQKVSISASRITIQDLLKKVEIQTGYRILYNAKTLSNIDPIAINVKNVSLAQALEIALKDKPITYLINQKTVVIKNKPDFAVPNPGWTNIQIRGMVINDSGQPLVGATVSVLTTAIRTVTDKEGRFFLQTVPEDGIISFSFLGYETQNMPVKNAVGFYTNIKVKLVSTSFQLLELGVVSTGYQNLNKERASGSFSKPDMKLFENRVGNRDIVSRMEGLVTGLSVTAGPRGVVSNNRLGKWQHYTEKHHQGAFHY